MLSSGHTLGGDAVGMVPVASVRFARPGGNARETRRTWAITPGIITERGATNSTPRRELLASDQWGSSHYEDPLRVSYFSFPFY